MTGKCTAETVLILSSGGLVKVLRGVGWDVRGGGRWESTDWKTGLRSFGTRVGGGGGGGGGRGMEDAEVS